MKITMKTFLSNCSKGLVLFSLALGTSCTDLELEATDSLFEDPNNLAFSGISEPSGFVTNMYNSLNGYLGDQANLYALSEVTTDAALVPTRGADWGDNGIWRQLHQHNWLTDHAFVTNVFLQWNALHFQAAQVLSPLTTEATTQDRADAHFLRGLGMWVILDNFGQIPVRDPEAPVTDFPAVLTGEEAVAQIVSDLEAAIADLPAAGPGDNNRASKAAARYLLAKVLLNKHVYTGTTPASSDMSRVVSLVDEIAAAGFGLQEGYFDIFRDSVDNETIWYIPTAVGNRIWNGLHYNMAPEISGGGWNGFSTLAEYYDLFEGDPNNNEPGNGQEERRGFVPTEGTPFTGESGTEESGEFPGFTKGSNIGFGFLVGQQYEIDGTPLNDRLGNPLDFKRDFTDNSGNPSLINNSETTGIRVMKYNPRYGGFTSHLVYFRYSDAHLMKAEAQLRGAGGDATATLNELRVIRGVAPLGGVSEQDILDERGRELYGEFWRRNDMIRFGQYTRQWSLKPDFTAGDENKNLFPIPASQITLNPNLTQNPGY